MRWAAAIVAAIALAPAGAVAQGLTGSRHDLSRTSTATIKAVSETRICVFCHTPHKAASTRLLWNKAAVVGQRGWATGTTTANGTQLPRDILPESKRCLSCHDGTIALGDVVNAGSGQPDPIAMTANAPSAAYLVGNGPSGDEMNGSHPVSIPYAGQSYNGITSGVTNPSAPGGYWAVTTSGCVSPSGICTNKPTDGPYINLRGTASNAGIECATCHEPHGKYPNTLFLRVTYDASRLCQACHNK